MINRYPLWKNLLVLTAVTLGVIYALPNVYPPDFAVQISNEEADSFISERVLDRAAARLDEAGIEYFGEAIDAGKAVIRFKNEDERLRAVGLIELALHDDAGDSRYIVSLNA
ncbi:MAG: protein translocase subunit SecD, partial [Pseudomonadales bacterium]|nr:protein translocase subunit SecD [Pseudomonadales bacterium]